MGSSDLESIVDSLENPNNLVTIRSENDRLHNKQVASHRLRAVVYSRLYVFRLFLECAKTQPGGIIEEHKRIWLWMQVIPKAIFGWDVFMDLSLTAGDITTNLQPAILRMLEGIGVLMGASTVIHAALDETQQLTDKYEEYFRSEQDLQQKRPILSVFLPVLTSSLPLIISGTGLSMQKLDEIYKSAVAKGKKPSVFTEVGSFETQEDQLMYLNRYLPKDFLSPELAGRIGYWLHGR